MKKLFKGLSLGLVATALILGGAASASADLTIGATSVTTNGAFTLTSVAGTVGTLFAANTTGAITIGGTAQTGTITLGSSSGDGIIDIGAGAGATTIQLGVSAGVDVITVGDADANVSVTDAQWSVSAAGAVAAVSLNLGTTTVLDVLSELTAAIDLADPAAGACVTGTDAVTGAALGDTVMVTPSADSAAWDSGTLSAFVESADTVKIVFCADADAADPASMTYRLTLLKF